MERMSMRSAAVAVVLVALGLVLVSQRRRRAGTQVPRLTRLRPQRRPLRITLDGSETVRLTATKAEGAQPGRLARPATDRVRPRRRRALDHGCTDGTDQRTLARSKATGRCACETGSPSWSPDGRTLFFDRCEPDTERDLRLDLPRRMPQGGGLEARDGRTGASGSLDTDPAVSPDGTPHRDQLSGDCEPGFGAGPCGHRHRWSPDPRSPQARAHPGHPARADLGSGRQADRVRGLRRRRLRTEQRCTSSTATASGLRRLTQWTFETGSPAWSPDGDVDRVPGRERPLRPPARRIGSSASPWDAGEGDASPPGCRARRLTQRGSRRASSATMRSSGRRPANEAGRRRGASAASSAASDGAASRGRREAGLDLEPPGRHRRESCSSSRARRATMNARQKPRSRAGARMQSSRARSRSSSSTRAATASSAAIRSRSAGSVLEPEIAGEPPQLRAERRERRRDVVARRSRRARARRAAHAACSRSDRSASGSAPTTHRSPRRTRYDAALGRTARAFAGGRSSRMRRSSSSAASSSDPSSRHSTRSSAPSAASTAGRWRSPGEVRAQPRTQVARLPDVEHGLVAVAEEVDARGRRRAGDERTPRVQPARPRRRELDDIGECRGAALLGEPEQRDEDLRGRERVG